MTNEVDVDEAALRAQAAALDVPADPAASSGEGQPAPGAVTDSAAEVARAEQFAAQAKPVIGKVLRGVVRMAVPNWSVSEQQQDDLAHSVSFALALWFPHEIPPKYAALLMVGMSVYGIADANRDPATGELRPRVKPRTDGAATAP